jgi:hypothetical protein
MWWNCDQCSMSYIIDEMEVRKAGLGYLGKVHMLELDLLVCRYIVHTKTDRHLLSSFFSRTSKNLHVCIRIQMRNWIIFFHNHGMKNSDVAGNISRQRLVEDGFTRYLAANRVQSLICRTIECWPSSGQKKNDGAPSNQSWNELNTCGVGVSMCQHGNSH